MGDGALSPDVRVLIGARDGTRNVREKIYSDGESMLVDVNGRSSVLSQYIEIHNGVNLSSHQPADVHSERWKQDTSHWIGNVPFCAERSCQCSSRRVREARNHRMVIDNIDGLHRQLQSWHATL